MKVHHGKRSSHDSHHGHGAQPTDEERILTRKQKAEREAHHEEEGHSPKKPKSEKRGKGDNAEEESSATDSAAEFEKFCKATSEHLSIQQMREILEANSQDSSGSDDAVVPRCQNVLFYGAVDKCPICGGTLEFTGKEYSCIGDYSEWSSCTYSTRDPPRREQALQIPDSLQKSPVADLIKEHQDPKKLPTRELASLDKPFAGMMICLSGRLTRTHQYWKSKIEKHGGKVANSVIGVSCLVVNPVEREQGGSSKLAEAVERGIPVVREAWLGDSIEKRIPQSLDTYDIISDLGVEGRAIPLDKQDPNAEALETINAELKVYGKRGVHKDTKLQDQGGKIFEKDGIIYNCAFSECNQGKMKNDFCITQLIMVPENRLHMYYKKGRIGDDANAEDRLEEWDNVDDAIKEFARLFEELTGNEFEPWEREKKIQKKGHKFFPVDLDDGIEVRHGALGLRQLGVAAAHCKLDPIVANFMKVICSQEIYRYALMETGLDFPELPLGMLSKAHLERCESMLLEFIGKLPTSETGQRNGAIWSDFSQRWFTLLPSTRPSIFRDPGDIAEHAASAFETIRDINAASHLIGDISGDTLEDPLSETYKKLGCSISPLEKDSDDFKMIVKYLETTYEPLEVGEISYGVSVENIFSVESPAYPSDEDMKELPNKVLLWCGSRSSNLMRHLHRGFLPAICPLPVPGYMFGRAVVCSDTAAEAARYGFTAVDRPEGFLILAVASLGENITELDSAPEDTKSLEEKGVGVKGLGKRKTDEKEHFVWKDDIKVPCGRLIPSENKDSPLDFNEYAVYNPQQVKIRFLVAVKYEEKDVEYDTAE